MAFFSIVTPCYNNAKELTKTIACIGDQTFRDWELILVDDGSTDNTEEVVSLFLRDPRILYFKQENKGVTAARNKGITLAKGEFVTFLDSDDEVTASWLYDFFKLSRDHPSSGYLSCGYYINNKKRLPKSDLNISPKKFSSLAGSFAIKRAIVEDIGGYDPVLKQSENYEMTARAIEKCLEQNLSIQHTNNYNFKYNHNPTPEGTVIRDSYRAEATLYLHEKYRESGVFHHRKKEFLLSSAVNFTRAKKFSTSRKIFYKNFFTYPSIENLIKIIIFEIPPLRKRKWMRREKIKDINKNQ